MEVLSEGSLNAGTVLEELLKRRHDTHRRVMYLSGVVVGHTHTHTRWWDTTSFMHTFTAHTTHSRETYLSLRPPVGRWRVWLDWSSLTQ